MATLAGLCDRGDLVHLGGGLGADEQPIGRMYAFPHVIEWFDNALPLLAPQFDEGRQSPLEQVDDLVHDFVAGEDLSFYERSHSMIPDTEGVWELKTPDVRLFGWFKMRRTFVIANADSAFRCKEHSLYAGYRDDVVRRRNGLDLNTPKFILGGYGDVL